MIDTWSQHAAGRYTTMHLQRNGATSGHAADRVFQAAMALAPMYAGACRTGFVILTAKPIAGHAQRASGGNAGQDDIAAAGALDVDPGRRQAPALDHRRASHPRQTAMPENAAAEPTATAQQ
jgi:hypothetical protein